MENYRCISSNCGKSNDCCHYNVKKFYDDTFAEEFEDEDVIIDEDLSDICLPNYRLYTDTDNPYQHYSPKEVYKELFDFYDNDCDGDHCLYQKDYDKRIRMQSSCVECKLSEYITCKNPKHPTNEIIDEMMRCFEAENKAFEEAGITEGTITYNCPICGGEAVVSRYLFN